MQQTKYASAVPKNLGLGSDLRPSSEGVHSPWSRQNTMSSMDAKNYIHHSYAYYIFVKYSNIKFTQPVQVLLQFTVFFLKIDRSRSIFYEFTAKDPNTTWSK